MMAELVPNLSSFLAREILKADNTIDPRREEGHEPVIHGGC